MRIRLWLKTLIFKIWKRPSQRFKLVNKKLRRKRICWTNKCTISQSCSINGVEITTRTIHIKTKSSKFRLSLRITTLWFRITTIWVDKITQKRHTSKSLKLRRHQVHKVSSIIKLITIRKLPKFKSCKLIMLK